MPPVEILMPELGESVHEGTVSRWLKNVGDFVKEDEPVVEIMTDKVNTELPSPATGILSQILIQEGDLVEVFKAMGVITPEGEAAAAPTAEQAAATAPKADTKVEATPEPKSEKAPAATTPTGRTWFSPVVRAMAKAHNLSDAQLAQLSGTGAGGRLTKRDLEAALKSGVPTASASPKLDAKPVAATVAGEGQSMAPLAGMRKMIAEAMVRSSQVPTVSTVTEIDVTAMVRFRELNKDSFQATYGVKLTYTPFFIKALSDALVEFPMVNASLRDDNQLVTNHNVHMGVAVSLGKDGSGGLIVPVIRNCEKLSIVEMAKELEEIARKARASELGVADVQGGTFTLSNPGSYGALFGTPMINAPQAAIGGAYAIQKKVAVVDDMIAIRSMMYFVLTYDHRIIDGLMAGRFLQALKAKIEKFDFLQ